MIGLRTFIVIKLMTPQLARMLLIIVGGYHSADNAMPVGWCVNIFMFVILNIRMYRINQFRDAEHAARGELSEEERDAIKKGILDMSEFDMGFRCIRQTLSLRSGVIIHAERDSMKY